MTRRLVLTLLAVLVEGAAFAQEPPGAERTEVVSAILGGGAVFMPPGTGEASTTTNYLVGVTITRNVNPWFGVSADLSVVLGQAAAHDLYGTVWPDQKAPNMLMSSGDLIVSPFRSDRSLVPFLQGGIGILRVYDADPGVKIGLPLNSLHPIVSAGGGVRWFPVRHYGVRAGYSFIAIGNDDEDPALAGQRAVHHAHRVSVALILTF